ncbi:MAG: substrate-binding domain-containing protein [Bacteroidota bacterium]
MKRINIGGVPEHFNLAWYLDLKKGSFKKKGINLRWKDFYGGTGEMNQALRSGEIDMAVILTEGVIKDIIDGNPSKIVQNFVSSPLIWGIHVAANSEFQEISDLRGRRAAISRYGSGSHLMSFINAENQGWNLSSDLNFEVINDLEGAVKGLTDKNADYFLWEKFTTKPIVDEGVFRRIGNCPTPWPCFVIAVREELLDKDLDAVKTILKVINKTTEVFKEIADIDKTIAQRYGQKLEDVQEWLSITEWSCQSPSETTINTVQSKLHELDIISNKYSYKDLVFQQN